MIKFATVKTLSEILDTPPFTIRKWAREGTIPSFKIDSSFRFDVQEVIQSIKKNNRY